LYYGKGKIWDVATGQQISEIGFSRHTMTSARFSVDTNKLVTGDAVRRTIVWDVRSGDIDFDKKEQAPFFFRPTGRVVVDVNYNTDNGQLHAVFSDGSVSMWQ
jgi:WD40 repeat protein